MIGQGQTEIFSPLPFFKGGILIRTFFKTPLWKSFSKEELKFYGETSPFEKGGSRGI
jgi:hypothetical protein